MHKRTWPAAASVAPAIVPSLLAAPPLALGDAVRAVSAADAIHIDVMDGHFVPNLAFTPAQTRAIAKATSVPLDVHLMMSKPLAWLDAFAEAGAFGITLHAEAVSDLPHAIAEVAQRGVAPGISVRAETDVVKTFERLGEAAHHLSLLLVMSVEPGFGGQQFNERALNNVAAAARTKGERQLSYAIEVDGGITHTTAPRCLAAGADSLVVGSALFAEQNVAASLSRWHSRYATKQL